MRRGNTWVAGAIALMLMIALPASSWVPETTSGLRDHWNKGVGWVINPNISGRAGAITGARTVNAVIADSFAAWTSAPLTAIPAGTTGGTTASTSVNANDGVNLICFVCTPPGGFGKDQIAVTITATDQSGIIQDADMIFNQSVAFITDDTPAPDPKQSLRTVATHEFGHFLGLEHSPVIRSVMNPFAPPQLFTLSYDDLAGIATNYPGPGFNLQSISGTIRNGAGAPVFGAHVFAESTTGVAPFPGVRKSPIGTLSNNSGTYTISGLAQDSYAVTAEPLDGPVMNTNFDGTPAFNTNYTTRQH